MGIPVEVKDEIATKLVNGATLSKSEMFLLSVLIGGQYKPTKGYAIKEEAPVKEKQVRRRATKLHRNWKQVIDRAQDYLQTAKRPIRLSFLAKICGIPDHGGTYVKFNKLVRANPNMLLTKNGRKIKVMLAYKNWAKKKIGLLG